MNWPSFFRVRRFCRIPTSQALVIWGASVLAALVAVLLVWTFGVLTELLVTRGDLIVSASDRSLAEAIAGPPDRASGEVIAYEDRGLLPLVWRNRDSIVGGWWLSWYQSWPALQANQSALVTQFAMGLGLAVVLSLSLWVLNLTVERAALCAVSRLRMAIQQQAVRLGASDLLVTGPARPRELFGPKTEVIRSGIAAWHRAIPYAPILAMLLLLLALQMHVWVTLAAVLLAGLSWLLLGWLEQRSRIREELWASHAQQQGSLLSEFLSQTRWIGGPLESGLHSFEELLGRYHGSVSRQSTSGARTRPLVLFFVLAGAGLILFLVGINVFREPPRITVAETVVLGTSLVCGYFPVRRLLQLQNVLEPAEEASGEVFVYLDRSSAVGQAPSAKPIDRLSRRLELVDVSLSDRSGRKLLDEVSLAVDARGRIAIVGTDPMVPLALAGLVPRCYDPAAGRVLYDGQDVRQATLESIRNQTGLVLEDGLLFTGTVTDNIQCGDQRFTPAKVSEAAKLAQAYDFIHRLPRGFDTEIGTHGMQLDPGEVFRIGLARAVLRDPAVLLVEEPDGELTTQGAALVDEALRRVSQNRTMIILANRLSTLRSAERVLLFHECRLYSEGSHAELLQKCDLYRHINYVRFNEFRDRVK